MASGRACARELGPDLGLRVGERQDQRVGRHGRDHLGLQHAAGRQAEEDVGAGHDLGQRARAGVLGVAGLLGVHLLGAALVDDALDVGDEDVLALQAEGDQQIEAGERRGAGARDRHLDAADVLADQLQAVEDRRRDDDRRAVLVVVEDRDLHALAQLALDDEALRRLDVLQVDAAEGRLQRRDDVDDPVGVGGVDLDVEHVDAGEFLEQAALALHHRLAGERPDVAEAQHRRAVGDDRHQIGAAR